VPIENWLDVFVVTEIKVTVEILVPVTLTTELLTNTTVLADVKEITGDTTARFLVVTA
jgi:hypothetical protein